ncbi:heavy metal translocating P-type ATPase [Candidatus Cerribacteria bacterium 'Amazon FNV 2010 28 9']|uniref:Heavy metal translocating P-type ATPase n=1 Tax=Candidatus Cerribacteria bacterium 'Amazon FNV 2010 28 9' TaxID=2081795 RepID=A0A317JT09_9BACT|nr:MAG: heavy metal translocating P-type ATPase [Candidatus Cerribacteria bacterium 'Amazon FNV 2010 28 9']
MVHTLSLLKRYTGFMILLLLGYSLFTFWSRHTFPSLFLFVGVILAGLFPFVIDMIQTMQKGNFGVDLIAVTSVLAGLVVHEYIAAAVILFMLSGGELLEEFAIRRAKKEITALVSQAPVSAHMRKERGLCDVSVDTLQIGNEVIVKPNEMIPVDGVVIEGNSSVDESKMTGESAPVQKRIHSSVYSGTTNGEGILTIRVTATSKQSKYAQIIELVQQAQEHKASFIRMADRYSVWFTIIAFSLAALGWLISHDPRTALAVLVVATPCPLIIAAPTAFAAGISLAAKKGIFIKDATSIEQLASAQTMLFDKTGTVTLGVSAIEDWIVLRGEKKDIQSYACSLEQFSTHILSRAFSEYAHTHHIPLYNVEAYTEILGKGVRGKVQTHTVLVGSASFLLSKRISIPKNILLREEEIQEKGTRIVYVAIDEVCAAIIHIGDQIRPDTKKFFAELKREIPHIALVTGDRREIAQNVAKQIGICDIISSCLPADKTKVVKQYQRQFSPVVMIGDGVNDAPSLATADVGIAIGGSQSTAATQVGDIVVMPSGLSVVLDALHISKRVMTIATQSIVVGIGLSIILMILSCFGVIQPLYGAFFQELIDVAVITNALRVLVP